MSLSYRFLGIPANLDEFLDKEKSKYSSTRARISHDCRVDSDALGSRTTTYTFYLVVESNDKRRKIVAEKYVGFNVSGFDPTRTLDTLNDRLVEGKERVARVLESNGFEVMEVAPDPRLTTA
jgi:hypothetical protein